MTLRGHSPYRWPSVSDKTPDDSADAVSAATCVRYCPGVEPVHFLNALWNALPSAKPSSSASSAKFAAPASSRAMARSRRTWSFSAW